MYIIIQIRRYKLDLLGNNSLRKQEKGKSKRKRKKGNEEYAFFNFNKTTFTGGKYIHLFNPMVLCGSGFGQ